ncbi:MAG: carbohydrate-binding protein [Lachnospiraceae bacterium]|nr:carbohydrate-binding protein [Lachnospiraceae bacterium]
MKRRVPILLSMLLAAGMCGAPTLSVQAAPQLNPYNSLEAEIPFDSSGITIVEDNGGKVVSGLDAGDYFYANDINFSQGLSAITITAKAAGPSIVEVHEGTPDGTLLGKFLVGNTNGEYKEFTRDMSNIEGKHNIVFVGKMGSASIDRWAAVAATAVDPDPTPTPDPDPTPTPDPDPTPTPGPKPGFNPYQTVPAEAVFDKSGIEVVKDGDRTVVSSVEKGDYFTVNDVKFTEGLSTMTILAKSDGAAVVEVHEGTAEGQMLGKFRIGNTAGEYKEFTAPMTNIEGKKNITFVGVMGNVSMDEWQAVIATTVDPDPTPTPDPDPTPTPDPDPTPTPDPDPTPTPDPTPIAEGMDLSYSINDWGTGYLVSFKLDNNTGNTVNDWKIKIKKTDINIGQSWCAHIAEEGDYYVFTPYEWNSTIYDRGQIQFGIIGSGSAPSTIPYVIE